MLKGHNILVTGGAGYVGSHTCKALARAGYTPVVFDNLSSGHARAVQWGPLCRGDLREPGEIRAALERYRPAAVLHFAALTSVAESEANPKAYFDNNVIGTQNLLAGMREFGVRALIFSSSCAVYGNPGVSPIGEDAPLAPISYYGKTKRDAEGLLRDAGEAGGLRSISLRYFNAAGADAEGELGEAHEPETHLIPLVLRAAAGGTPVFIYGADYGTPDGTCVRDYVHVADLADAHVKALERVPGVAGARAYNLGSERGYSVEEVIACAERVTGRKIQKRVCARREGDAPELVADATRARGELGWVARRSGLEEVVETAWAWETSSLRIKGG